METTRKSVSEIVDNNEYCPLPLHVIPNYMGINLVSVDSIEWDKLEDGQLTKLIIHFIPHVEGPPNRNPKHITMDETELEIINYFLKQASNQYKDNKTPAEGDLEDMGIKLYDTLFGYRDNKPELPRDNPLKYSLIEIFEDLKFGRPANQQHQLTEFINILKKQELLENE